MTINDKNKKATWYTWLNVIIVNNVQGFILLQFANLLAITLTVVIIGGVDDKSYPTTILFTTN